MCVDSSGRKRWGFLTPPLQGADLRAALAIFSNKSQILWYKNISGGKTDDWSKIKKKVYYFFNHLPIVSKNLSKTLKSQKFDSTKILVILVQKYIYLNFSFPYRTTIYEIQNISRSTRTQKFVF